MAAKGEYASRDRSHLKAFARSLRMAVGQEAGEGWSSTKEKNGLILDLVILD